MEQVATSKVWFLAIRPKTLIASICPIAIGGMLANPFNPLMFVCILFAALFIQIGTNIANDYYDCIQGTDTKERKGPMRVSQAGLLPLKVVQQGFVFSFILACLFGLYPMMKGGITIRLLGACCILLGVYYSKGKYSLSHTGLADFCALFFFGVLAAGYCQFLVSGSFSSIGFIAGIGPGLISTALLCANNLRDRKEDAKNNKITLIVRFGELFGKIEYIFCLTVANALLALFCPYFFWVFTLGSISPIKTCLTKKAPVELLEKTAKLLVLYTLLFAIGRFF
jgi:1,4-dihydroxy-2-naphthoate octaprenyltransferase